MGIESGHGSLRAGSAKNLEGVGRKRALQLKSIVAIFPSVRNRPLFSRRRSAYFLPVAAGFRAFDYHFTTFYRKRRRQLTPAFSIGPRSQVPLVALEVALSAEPLENRPRDDGYGCWTPGLRLLDARATIPVSVDELRGQVLDRFVIHQQAVHHWYDLEPLRPFESGFIDADD